MPCVALLLLALCATDVEVELPSDWAVGERHRIELVRERERYTDGRQVMRLGSRTTIEFEVLAKDESGYVFRWTHGPARLLADVAGLGPAAERLADLQRGLVLDMHTDPLGTPLRLADPAGYRAFIDRSSAEVLAFLGHDGSHAAELDLAHESVRPLLDPNAMESLALEEPALLYMACGGRFQLDRPLEYEDRLPNPFGGEPFPTRAAFTLERSARADLGLLGRAEAALELGDFSGAARALEAVGELAGPSASAEREALWSRLRADVDRRLETARGALASAPEEALRVLAGLAGSLHRAGELEALEREARAALATAAEVAPFRSAAASGRLLAVRVFVRDLRAGAAVSEARRDAFRALLASEEDQGVLNHALVGIVLTELAPFAEVLHERLRTAPPDAALAIALAGARSGERDWVPALRAQLDLAPPFALELGESPLALAPIDVDGDGRLELAAACEGGAVRLIHPRGDAGPGAASAWLGARFAPPPDARRGPLVDVASADLDGDGRADLALLFAGSRSSVAGSLWPLPFRGAGFAAGAPAATGLAPTRLASADVDGDGRAELFASAQNSHHVNAFVARMDAGAVRLERQPDLGAGFGPIDLCAVDLERDGAVELVVANAFGRDVSVLRTARR